MGTQEQSRGQNACLWARCTCSYAPGCCKDTARTETQVTGLVDSGHISDFLILVYFYVFLSFTKSHLNVGYYYSYISTC